MHYIMSLRGGAVIASEARQRRGNPDFRWLDCHGPAGLAMTVLMGGSG